MTQNRPPGTNGQAAAAKKDSEPPSRPLRRSEQVPALRLIVTPAALYEAHKDYAKLVEARRLGLVDEATSLRLGLRALNRILEAERERAR